MNAAPDEIEGLCRVLGSRFGRLYSIAPLNSGSTGRSFLLLTESGRFVAKRFDRDSMALLGPDAQSALLGSLATAGIAPRAVLSDPAAGLLVTDYIADARAVSARRLREPAMIHTLASVLRQLHAIAAELPDYAPLDYAERYLARVGGVAALSPADRERYRELIAIAAEPLAGGRSVCHNDLTADHLLFGPQPKLIDFDYAVAAAPVLDLASVVVMNGFEAAEAEALLAAYYGGSPAISATGFARVQRLQQLLAHFWALAAAADAPAIVDEYRIRDD